MSSIVTSIMTQSPTNIQKESKQNGGDEDQIHGGSSVTCDLSYQDEEGELKEPMVTPKGTTYLSNDGEYSPEETKRPTRVQSTQSLLGLVGLEGHEESDGDLSSTGISAVTEEQEMMDIVVSPTTPASLSEGQGIEECNSVTPPGSVQGPGILSLSPPRLTTYSAGSVCSASITESFVLQPRPIQAHQRQNHIPQESPRFSRSPLVQHSQILPLPRSRPPRAPNSTLPGGNNSVSGGPILAPRAGTEPTSISGSNPSGGGHTRTSTDATNYSFLSTLTDISGGEYAVPRRRTLSWDNNANPKKTGSAMESRSLGGPSTPGSILQPILFPDDLDATARPPTSISASNLRKALPVMSGQTATAPTHPLSSRNTITASLPPRENLHPLIRKLQSMSHTPTTSFNASLPQSKDPNNLEQPLVQEAYQPTSTKSGNTVSTSTTSPFLHIQDEKKDDDSSRSHRIKRQKQLPERKSSDYGSFTSSFCSSSTIRLQKKTMPSPGNLRGAFDRQSSPPRIGKSGGSGDLKQRFDLADILYQTKECSAETDIIEDIERRNRFDKGARKSNSDFSSFSEWPYVLLVWGIFNLVVRGFVLSASEEPRNLLVSNKLIQYCLGLGAATIVKRKLSKTFFDRQVIGYYRDGLSMIRDFWSIFNEITVLATKRDDENGNYNSDEKHILRFRSVWKGIDNTINGNDSSLHESVETTREDFIDSAQTLYEGLVRRGGEGMLSFESICEVAKLHDGSIDQSKNKILSELFRPLHGCVSKFEFVKSTDRLFKTTTLLKANIDNASRICHSVDRIVNTVFFTIAATLATSVIGVDTNILIFTLLGVSVNVAFGICFYGAENLKGIIRLLIQKSYDVGDRVCFVKIGDTHTKVENGPPSGGWIVESFNLYQTTLRKGITGERSVISNGSVFFMNSSVMNWKPSHRALVRLSVEFSNRIGREKIKDIHSQISKWVENHPCEWTHLESFRMVDEDIHTQRVRYEVVLRHRESWYDYTAVQDSKSDILELLHELRSGDES